MLNPVLLAMKNVWLHLFQHWGGETGRPKTQVCKEEEVRLICEVRQRLGQVKEQLSEVDARLEEHRQLSKRKF